ncbi:MAG: S8 family serine peptidase, partial [Pseudomonadota bacterium]
DNDGAADRGVISTGVDDDIAFPGDPLNDADDLGDFYFVSGTSFAAPHVSGALALVLDAFPNLEPEDALDLLLSTADDYVDPNNDVVLGVPAGVGVDAVSGVGILNLEAAFSPQGTSSLSFQTADTVLSVPVGALAAPASGAFGDWARASGAFSDLVFQDSYARGFRLGEIDAAPSAARFQDFDTRARFHEGDWGGVAVGGFSMDWFTPAVRFDPAAPYTPDPETSFTTRFAFSGGEVQAGRGSTPESIGPSLSLVSDPTTNAAELGGADAWAMVAHDIGPVRAQAFSETSEGRDAAGLALIESGDDWTVRAAFVSERDETSSLGAAVQSRFGLQDGMRADAVRLEGAVDV